MMPHPMSKFSTRFCHPVGFRHARRFLAQPGRCSVLALAIALVSLACAPATLRAQPANDDFLSAEVITGDIGTVFGSNVGATEEPNEPKHWQQISRGASVWYRWVA